MNVDVVQGSIVDVEADAVIVNLFEGVTRPGGATGALDRALGGKITQLIADSEFKGELEETLRLHFPGESPRKAVVVGLGPSDAFSLERARRASRAALKAAATGNTKRIATIVHGAGIGGLDPEACAQAVTEGALLGAYRYTAMKSDPPGCSLEELWIVEHDAAKLEAMRRGAGRGRILAEATNFTRDLVNAPPNHMTPAHLADRAQALADEHGLHCQILEWEEMERLNMGALLAVAKGSAHPPKLIVLEYAGAPAGPTLGLVGKGVTFDTGGISLKSAAGMGTMKSDMAGAAAVLGAMQAIGRLKPPIRVLAVVPCVENMPSGEAFRPGDVLTAMTGKTIEIESTDAEGRLILADASAYAVSRGVDWLVDVATLTGACVVALGTLYSGVVSNNDALMDKLMQAAARSGERLWRLPADPEYREQYRSDVADIKNTGGRYAGAITGGLFVGEFVGDTPWAHIDIAGTAFPVHGAKKQPDGATGVAVRTLAELSEALAQQP